MSYIHWLSQLAFLIKCTFCWNPINCSLGERWCFPLDWRDLPGCLSLFASGTTKGKIMPFCKGKLGHEKATSFLSTATENLQSGKPFYLDVKTGRCLGLVLKFTDDYVKLLFRTRLFFAPRKLPHQRLWIGSVVTVSISADPVWGEYTATCLCFIKYG